MTAPSRLVITYATGEVRVLTFASPFERALCMIHLAHVPVMLRPVDGD